MTTSVDILICNYVMDVVLPHESPNAEFSIEVHPGSPLSHHYSAWISSGLQYSRCPWKRLPLPL